MKKFFIALGLLLGLLSACNTPTTPKEEVKDPVLTVVSDLVIECRAEGELAEIRYTIENPTATGMVSVISDVQWLADFNSQSYGVITFRVLPNENEVPRTTMLILMYEDRMQAVTINQAAGEIGIGSDFLREATYIDGFYYGLVFGGTVPNYYFTFSNKGFDDQGAALAGGWYYIVDIYSNQEPQGSDITLPYGEYVVDRTNSYAAQTLSVSYSQYYEMGPTGEVEVEQGFVEGKLVIDEEGLVLQVTDDAGTTHCVKFEGHAYNIMDASATDPSEPEEGLDSLSNLTGDVTVNADEWSNVAAYYGDYYGVGAGNWLMLFQKYGGQADALQFDLITGEVGYDADFSGTYTCSNSGEQYTFFPGEYYYGYYLGSWYFWLDGGVVTEESAYAALIDGTLTISKNEDGSYSFELEGIDCQEEPNTISASWTATLSKKDYSEGFPTRQNAVGKPSIAKRPMR